MKNFSFHQICLSKIKEGEFIEFSTLHSLFQICDNFAFVTTNMWHFYPSYYTDTSDILVIVLLEVMRQLRKYFYKEWNGIWTPCRVFRIIWMIWMIRITLNNSNNWKSCEIQINFGFMVSGQKMSNWRKMNLFQILL